MNSPASTVNLRVTLEQPLQARGVTFPLDMCGFGTSRSSDTSLYGLHSPYKLDFGFGLSHQAAEALATTPAGFVLP
eukprot:771230-Rhodomonas_salina.1